MTPLYIRADSDEKTGTGHVMRCLALGQAWRDAGGAVVFGTQCRNSAILRRLCREGFEVREPEERELPPEPDAWFVLDGYQFEAEYQRRLRDAGWRILTIDDQTHLDHYWSDALLNQNIGAERLPYRCEVPTRLLLGPSYALLRREFRAWRGWHREIPALARRLLVTFGGSDPQRLALRAVEALCSVAIDGLETVIVAGAECQVFPELQRVSQEAGIGLLTNITDMPSQIARADIVLSAAGSTCWELAFLGAPAVLIVTADNQREIGAGLAERGCALNLGWHVDVTAAEIASAIRDLAFNRSGRAALSAASSALIDGRGAERVVAALIQ